MNISSNFLLQDREDYLIYLRFLHICTVFSLKENYSHIIISRKWCVVIDIIWRFCQVELEC